jgi:hypothetical protein
VKSVPWLSIKFGSELSPELLDNIDINALYTTNKILYEYDIFITTPTLYNYSPFVLFLCLISTAVAVVLELAAGN